MQRDDLKLLNLFSKIRIFYIKDGNDVLEDFSLKK